MKTNRKDLRPSATFRATCSKDLRPSAPFVPLYSWWMSDQRFLSEDFVDAVFFSLFFAVAFGLFYLERSTSQS
jgi:hypothetical protein